MRWRSPIPRVSVIIASYRWPEALRVSLASALAQTVDEIEVLVVEDGKDRGSAAVVADASDRRVRRLSHTPASGSQSGPNTLGRRRARAPVVAYLGHDDVWHPEHLAGLLASLRPDSDAVHAATLLLGVGEDTRVLVAGLDPWEPGTFVPPSSLAHWRDSPRIPAWIAPDASGMPVDHALLVGAHARGARIVAAGAPTVFKHPAAWRLDSYRTRDAEPQARVHERLAADPHLGYRLLGEALAAGVPRALVAPPEAGPGVIADYNRRMKGLPARFGPPVRRWRPEALLPFPGWYQPEAVAGARYAWTRRGARALVRLDAPAGRGELGVRIVVRHTLHESHLDEVVADLDGDAVALTRAESGEGTLVMTGWLGRPPRTPMVEVGLTTLFSPPPRADSAGADPRDLGVAVDEIELLTRRAGRRHQV